MSTVNAEKPNKYVRKCQPATKTPAIAGKLAGKQPIVLAVKHSEYHWSWIATYPSMAEVRAFVVRTTENQDGEDASPAISLDRMVVMSVMQAYTLRATTQSILERHHAVVGHLSCKEQMQWLGRLMAKAADADEVRQTEDPILREIADLMPKGFIAALAEQSCE